MPTDSQVCACSLSLRSPYASELEYDCLCARTRQSILFSCAWLIATRKLLFCEPFGQGYPKEQSARKISDTKLLKSVKEKSQVDFITLLERLDHNLITKVLQKNNVVDYVLNHGTDIAMINWIKQHI